jgi:hypothetical protein
MIIARELLDQGVVVEASHARFTTEASDIGLRPGEWPRIIETKIGNGQPFIAMRKEVRDGDLLWVDYLQGNGCIWLRIFND